jgi:hypothetical protein
VDTSFVGGLTERFNMTTEEDNINHLCEDVQSHEQAIFIVAAIRFAAESPQFAEKNGSFGVDVLKVWLNEKPE